MNIGIDLGTTNSALAWINPAEADDVSFPPIRVFDDDDARLRSLDQPIPPIRPIVDVTAAFHRRVGGSDACRDRMTNDRREIFEDAMDRGIGEAGVR